MKDVGTFCVGGLNKLDSGMAATSLKLDRLYYKFLGGSGFETRLVLWPATPKAPWAMKPTAYR